jgi:hypothetical protein
MSPWFGIPQAFRFNWQHAFNCYSFKLIKLSTTDPYVHFR